MREYEFKPRITEIEWLSGSDIAVLWRALPTLPKAPEPDRLVYLLTVAICRPYLWLLRDPRSRRMIDVAESYADGQASADEMCDAERDALSAWQEYDDRYRDETYSFSHSQATVLLTNFRGHKLGWEAAASDAIGVSRAIAFGQEGLLGSPWSDETLAHPAIVAARDKETARILDLIREVFGNPFRPFHFAPEWRTDIAVALALQMYESRDFSARPILADALQDVGCDNTDILAHCRDPQQVHVRGCWVVDLVLGKA